MINLIQVFLYLLVLGGAVGLGALAFGSKEKRLKTGMIGLRIFAIGGVALALTYAFVPETIREKPISELLAAAPTPAVCGNGACESGESIANCPTDCKPLAVAGEICSDYTTTTLSSLNFYTIAATGGVHRYWKDQSSAAEVVADTSNFKASAKKPLRILWGNANTTNGYYSKIEDRITECGGTTSLSPINPNGLYQNGTISITVKNTDGQVISADSYNQSMGAGDVKTLPTTISGTWQRAHPYGFLFVVEYNSTSLDNVIVDFGDTTAVAVPTSFTHTSTYRTAKAYNVPAQFSNTDLIGSIIVDADDTNQPLVIYSDINITVFDKNLYLDEDVLDALGRPTVKIGAEDEDGNLIGFFQTGMSKLVYLS